MSFLFDNQHHLATQQQKTAASATVLFHNFPFNPSTVAAAALRSILAVSKLNRVARWKCYIGKRCKCGLAGSWISSYHGWIVRYGQFVIILLRRSFIFYPNFYANAKSQNQSWRRIIWLISWNCRRIICNSPRIRRIIWYCYFDNFWNDNCHCLPTNRTVSVLTSIRFKCRLNINNPSNIIRSFNFSSWIISPYSIFMNTICRLIIRF